MYRVWWVEWVLKTTLMFSDQWMFVIHGSIHWMHGLFIKDIGVLQISQISQSPMTTVCMTLFFSADALVPLLVHGNWRRWTQARRHLHWSFSKGVWLCQWRLHWSVHDFAWPNCLGFESIFRPIWYWWTPTVDDSSWIIPCQSHINPISIPYVDPT